MDWEDCIALQATGLLTYENFKEGYRTLPTAREPGRRMLFKRNNLVGLVTSTIEIIESGKPT